MNKEATLLILAAGMGSRYGGLKQIDPLGPSGETIMDYSIYDAVKAGFTKVVFVVRESFKKDFEELANRKYADLIKTEFVIQELDKVPAGCTYNPERVKPWGTAHAVLMAKDVIHEPFAVINADDFYGRDSFRVLGDFLLNAQNSKGRYSMVGFQVFNTLSESGGVSRGICTMNEQHLLTYVEEHHKIAKGENGIRGLNSSKEEVDIDPNALVSMNMWGFTPDIFEESENFFKGFLKENGQKTDSEFYIPFVVNELLKQGKISVEVLKTDSSWFGVTYKEDRQSVVDRLQDLADKGIYPANLLKR